MRSSEEAGQVPHPSILPPKGMLIALALQFPLAVLAWPWRPSANLALIGFLLLAMGAALNLWASGRFTKHEVGICPFSPAPRLVEDGPYRFTRNPMYLSLALVYLGVTALINSLWPLLLFPPVIWIISTFVIAREEAYLERKFGATYLEYKKRVRRWL